MPFQKSGPLSQDELFQLWLSVVDQQGYASPLITQPDSGIELIKQGHAQFAAVSSAADQTFQSLYILPWSGQTNDPASGAEFATVQIVVQRSNASVIPAGTPLVFSSSLRYLHAPDDYSANGPVQVLTGREYIGLDSVVIGAGELGPVTVTARAARPGAGYNLPAPGTIVVLAQPGATFSNDGASVAPVAGSNRLTLRDEPEVLTNDQLGQYVLFTAGANVGRIARMVGYEPSTPGNGGVALLSAELIAQVSGITGTFIPGEPVRTAAVPLAGSLVSLNGTYMLVAWSSLAVPAVTNVVTGLQSGATATITAVVQQPAFAAESNTAAWRVLAWVEDLGVSVTNPESPSGGRTPVLDALGDEREIPRSPGEPDDVYRERVATPADVVSPNAIRRAMNRVLVPLGIDGCFREVGSEIMRGFFYDGDPTSTDPNIAFAYDFDLTLRPQDRYKFLLDYTEFRAFFLIGVPNLGVGEFGFAFDDHPHGFFDATPFDDFLDGSPAGNAAIYRRLHNNIATVIAGGVGFDLVLDDNPCV